MKKYILYVHGFNSAPGDKVKQIRKHFPEYEVLAPKLPNDPHETIASLIELLSNKEEVHIIGNSLGGFYTLILAKTFKEKDDFFYYLINPQLWPVDSFTPRIGEKVIKNRGTKTFEISSKFVNYLKDLELHIDPKTFLYVEWFFGKNDKVVDHEKTLNYLYSLKIPFRYNISPQDHSYKNLEYLFEAIKQNGL